MRDSRLERGRGNREAGQENAKHRTTRLAADLAPAAVGLDDRVDDGEPEPDPAGGARPSRVGPGESLEDVRVSLVGDAESLVGDPDRDLAAGRAAGELDSVSGLRVLDGVLEQCVEGDPELFRIRAQRPAGKGAKQPVARGDL